MNIMKGFIYGQTEYNLLKSAVRLEDYIKLAKENSFDFLTITDNNLYASYKFYKECNKNNIKPIIGIEYEYVINNIKSKLLLYAANNTGYKNIMKISTLLKTDNELNIDDILKYDGIKFVYVYDNSYLEALVMANDNEIDSYLDKFNNNSYIGISYTNKPNKVNLIKEIEIIAKNKNINIIPIHQCLFLNPDDQIIYESLRKIDNDEAKIDPFDDYSFLLNPNEDIRIDNFVKDINYDLYNEKVALPKFPDTRGVSSKEFLEALCYKGLSRRGIGNNNEYIKRLEYELSVINKMGYDDYFLIVWDYIKYAKTNGILVGPGRGSGAASLVAYCLGITDIDPLKFDFIFERFLNPERVSMPDIDTDFPDVLRDKVIEYVKNFYGYDHVCNITTFDTFKIKSAARDLSKVFGINNDKATEIIKMVEKYGYDTLLEQYKGRDLYDFLYVAKGIEGFPKNVSTHPAGIIIGERKLDDIIPLQKGINGLLQAQLEKDDLESIGLLKMDFLGIRNLTMISDMMKMVSFNMKDLRNIPLDDPKVYKLLCNADTLGLFQLESQGIRRVLRDLKPERFTDLVAVIALYRPGPMDNIPEFIRRRHGEKFNYIHNDLKPILEETYGIIVYQEQIMKIAQVFAGFSLGEADLLRRAISKKDASKIDALKNEFIERSIKKNYSKELATEIYNLIYKFADYGFNKSHSVVYAFVAYQMAYFKVNYFNVFMSCMLNYVLSNRETLASYIDYAKKHGLIILPPNVNISNEKFIYEIDRLFMPINTIYSIGSIQERAIIEEREKNGLFKSFSDFKARCSFLSTAQIEALVYSGALDIFGEAKKNMIEKSSKTNDIIFSHLVGVIEDNNEYSFEYLAAKEYEYLGINIKYNIHNKITDLINKYKTVPLNKLLENSYANCIVSISNIKTIKTKKGDNMLIFDISDGKIDIRAVVFPKYYDSLKSVVKPNSLFNIRGKLEKDNRNEYSFNVYDIKMIEN